MKRAKIAQLFGAAVSAALVAIFPAAADSISAVEGARATERAGRYLTDQDITVLDRYGGNDDHPVYYGGDYGGDPHDAPAPYVPYPQGYLYDEYYGD